MNNINDFIIHDGVLKEYLGSEPDVTIPEGVHTIDATAFMDNSRLCSLTIPSGVTTIGSSAFRMCDHLQTVTIPDSVTSIGSSAFYGCEQLTEVLIPNKVTSIQDYTFQECRNLWSVSIPDSVTSIGYSAFCACRSLTRINGFRNVRSIDARAFWGCSSLSKLPFPKHSISIGYGAFSECPGLADESGFVIFNNNLYGYFGSSQIVVIPEGITAIQEYSFLFNQIHSVFIPNSVTSIGDSAFGSCKNLGSVTIPDSVKTIGIGAFQDCTSLEYVVLPKDLTSLRKGVFERCNHLKTINVPDKVTCINEDVFWGCRKLSQITLPAGLEQLESALEYVFVHQTDLKVLTAPGLSPQTIKEPVCQIAAAMGYLSNPQLYRDPAIAEAYQKSIRRHKKQMIDTVFSLDLVPALSQLAQLGNITVKNFETEYFQPALEAGADQCVAFLMDWKHHNISPEESYRQMMRQLKKDPFNVADMKKLWLYEKLPDGSICITGYKGSASAIEIPERIGKSFVTAIGDSAFDVYKPGRTAEQQSILTNLQSITIPNGVSSIGSKAFSWCQNLNHIQLPDRLLSIGDHAFSCCNHLLSVSFSNSIATIGDFAFAWCNFLQSISIPDSVTSIGTEAFTGCTSLSSLTIPKDLTALGPSAFLECKNLADQDGFVIVNNLLFDYYGPGDHVTIPEGVTVIGEHSFRGHHNITGLTIPKSVIRIENAAFLGCRGLADNDGFVIVKDMLFDYCGPGGEVTIPDGVRAISNSAFELCKDLQAVTIPDSVETIGHFAFRGCSNLTTTTLSNHVKYIGNSAFGGCSKLTAMTIPDSVVSIGPSAFWGCSGLADPKGFVIIRNILYSYSGSVRKVQIPKGVIHIENLAFTLASETTKILLPQSVTSIGSSAFHGCGAGTTFVIPDSVTFIGKDAFPKQALIYATAGSYARAYARKNRIFFRTLPTDPSNEGHTSQCK